jgi:hypothetical protein
VDAVEETRRRVKSRALKRCLDGFQGGWLCSHRLGHVQVRALSLQLGLALGLARADCVLSSFFESGSARGDVVVDALLQTVHVIGSGGIILLCVLCLAGIFGVCGVVCLAHVNTGAMQGERTTTLQDQLSVPAKLAATNLAPTVFIHAYAFYSYLAIPSSLPIHNFGQYNSMRRTKWSCDLQVHPSA